MSLLGKRIVVLGGTAGIGFAVARAAAEAGAAPVVASNSKERVAAAVARLGDDAAGHVVDVLDQEGVHGFFVEVGSFNHLVYTAGDRPRLAPVRTELWNVVPAHQREQLLAEHAARLPVRHIPQAEAVAKAYIYALEAKYCTGSVIEIDGGASLM